MAVPVVMSNGQGASGNGFAAYLAALQDNRERKRSERLERLALMLNDQQSQRRDRTDRMNAYLPFIMGREQMASNAAALQQQFDLSNRQFGLAETQANRTDALANRMQEFTERGFTEMSASNKAALAEAAAGRASASTEAAADRAHNLEVATLGQKPLLEQIGLLREQTTEAERQRKNAALQDMLTRSRSEAESGAASKIGASSDREALAVAKQSGMIEDIEGDVRSQFRAAADAQSRGPLEYLRDKFRPGAPFLEAHKAGAYYNEAVKAMSGSDENTAIAGYRVVKEILNNPPPTEADKLFNEKIRSSAAFKRARELDRKMQLSPAESSVAKSEKLFEEMERIRRESDKFRPRVAPDQEGAALLEEYMKSLQEGR